MRLKPFTEIEPGEQDTLSISFADEVGTAVPISTVWLCSVSPESKIPDASPAAVLLGSAQLEGNISKQLVLGGVDGCTYVLDASITLDDGRVLKNWSTLLCVSARRNLVDAGPWR